MPEIAGAVVLVGVSLTRTIEVEVRNTGLFPVIEVQVLVAVYPAITKVPAAESGRVKLAKDWPSITAQVFGITVREVGTEVEQEYQAIEIDGAGIPVTVAVELIVDPTCIVPETAGAVANTGADDTSEVDAVNISVVPLADPLTTDVALTLTMMYFPPSIA